MVGGAFDHVGELPASNVGLWNGMSWDSLGTGLERNPHTIAIHNGVPYAGGYVSDGGMKR